MESEKYCLQWNNFQKNIASSFKYLRQDIEFADVSLVSADNQKIEAHKVIMSSASNFFRSILNGSKHSHPLIYMRGIKGKYLKSVVDFIYHGQVNIEQEDLNDFLQIAEDLELKGLTSVNSEPYDPPIVETKQKAPPSKPKITKAEENIDPHIVETKEKATKITKAEENIDTHIEDTKEKVTMSKPKITKEDKSINTVANQATVEQSPNDSMEIMPDEHMINLFDDSISTEAKFSVSFKDANPELDLMIASMLEYENGQWKCGKCGTTKKDKTRVKRHIETHIDGIYHPCGHCDKSLKTRNALQAHIYKNHSLIGKMEQVAIEQNYI